MKTLRTLSLLSFAIAVTLGIAKSAIISIEGDRRHAPTEADSTSPSTEQDDDIKPAPHPDWKKMRDEWEARGSPFEYPIAPAQHVKVPCWEYGDECGIPGGKCGKIRKLANRPLYKEECAELRAHRPIERRDEARRDCPRGGCPYSQDLDQQEE